MCVFSDSLHMGVHTPTLVVIAALLAVMQLQVLHAYTCVPELDARNQVITMCAMPSHGDLGLGRTKLCHLSEGWNGVELFAGKPRYVFGPDVAACMLLYVVWNKLMIKTAQHVMYDDDSSRLDGSYLQAKVTQPLYNMFYCTHQLHRSYRVCICAVLAPSPC